MIDGKSFFDQPINSNLKTYDVIRKIATGQGDDYTTGRLSDYSYFNNYYKMITIDLNKQQVFHFWCRSKSNSKNHFMANLDRAGNRTRFFIVEEAKELFWTSYKELLKK